MVNQSIFHSLQRTENTHLAGGCATQLKNMLIKLDRLRKQVLKCNTSSRWFDLFDLLNPDSDQFCYLSKSTTFWRGMCHPKLSRSTWWSYISICNLNWDVLDLDGSTLWNMPFGKLAVLENFIAGYLPKWCNFLSLKQWVTQLNRVNAMAPGWRYWDQPSHQSQKGDGYDWSAAWFGEGWGECGIFFCQLWSIELNCAV